MGVNPGMSAALTFTVTDEDTAIAVGSGDVPVLGTPRLIAWCEAVTVVALAPGLEDGQTSVGAEVTVSHVAPTAVGREVQVKATIDWVEGRQVTFSVTATEGDTGVMTGTIIRVVVDRERFVSRL